MFVSWEIPLPVCNACSSAVIGQFHMGFIQNQDGESRTWTGITNLPALRLRLVSSAKCIFHITSNHALIVFRTSSFLSPRMATVIFPRSGPRVGLDFLVCYVVAKHAGKPEVSTCCSGEPANAAPSSGFCSMNYLYCLFIQVSSS